MNSNRNSNFTHNNLSFLPTTQIHLKFFSSYLTFSPPRKKQGISTLLFSVLYSPFLPPVHLPSFPLALLCTHFPLHTLMQPLQSHVQPYLRLLQSKAYTRSQRYPPPNSDYESDNLVSSASSGISTSFSCLSFFSIL